MAGRPSWTRRYVLAANIVNPLNRPWGHINVPAAQPSNVDTNSDTCLRSFSQLEGEETYHLPSVGSGVYAAQPTPTPFTI